jgi:hypothetical protein
LAPGGRKYAQARWSHEIDGRSPAFVKWHFLDDDVARATFELDAGAGAEAFFADQRQPVISER